MQTELWDGSVINAQESVKDGATEVVMSVPPGVIVRVIVNDRIAYQAVAR